MYMPCSNECQKAGISAWPILNVLVSLPINSRASKSPELLESIPKGD